ncbi:MAG: hypothetical protein EOP51_30845, partial [Sphingobacteriales bacterium]
LGCVAPTNNMAGKIALIFRGDCEFGAKALVAQNQGAIAVIIVNNVSGGPVGMGVGAVGASVTIPVMMISLEDGLAINSKLIAGETVKISITTWGSGKTHDLGVLYNGLSMFHAFAVPHSQIVTGNGNPVAYKGYDGAFIANFGTSNETSVKLKAVTTFTPSESTVATTVRMDSTTFSAFPASDSILAVGMSNSYDVHSTQKGRFDVIYSLSANLADEFIGNNTASYSYHITDNVFSKSRYDFTKNQPIANIYYRVGGTDPFMGGNLYYVAKGGYGALNAKFSISKSGDTLLNGSFVEMLLYKWKDTVVADSMVEVGEMELVGLGGVSFGPTDIGGQFYTADFQKVDAFGGPIGGTVELEDNSWYYVAAVVPGDCFLGMDGILNYYPRTYLRHNAGSTPYTEFSSFLYPGDRAILDNDISNTPNLVNTMFFFEVGGVTTDEAIDSARFAQQKTGFIPSISL